jgi:hypothetical protein
MMVQRRKTKQEFYEKRVVRLDGCWKWTGKKDAFGYGVVQLGRELPRTGAHRVSWELNYGEIPNGLHVLHKCDNPECTNPEHLFVGTALDNVRDAQRKGRLKVASKGWKGERTHCHRGHEFDDGNTKFYKGIRLCRKCRAENQLAYKARKNANSVHSF